jgi:putative intracellular protease/amidase
MGKAVIIISNEVEDVEFVCPFYRLQESGMRVDVATEGK